MTYTSSPVVAPFRPASCARIGTRTFSLALNGWPPARTAPVALSGQSWSTRSVRYGARATTALPLAFLAALHPGRVHVARTTAQGYAGSTSSSARAGKSGRARMPCPRTVTTATVLQITRSATPCAMPQQVSCQAAPCTPPAHRAQRVGPSFALPESPGLCALPPDGR
jgi:hypothetical protein